MTTSRRDFIRVSSAAGLTAVLAAGCDVRGSHGHGSHGHGSGSYDEPMIGEVVPSDAPLPDPFQVRLPIPAVLHPARSDGEADYYAITQRAAQAEILPGLKTTVWGYNGTFPGPTLETRSGRRVVVTHRNELHQPTTTHLHGGHTPPDSDGYPLDLTMPVGRSDAGPMTGMSKPIKISHGERTYTYPQDQRAMTLWYHDHRMDYTAQSVYRGLAGFHIIRDDVEDALPLPKGEREIPLMITDRSFAEDGSFHYPARDPSMRHPGVRKKYMQGVLGDVVLVNGAPWPVLEVSATRYRFRMLNASNARRYKLRLHPSPTDGAPFTQVGSDGGLLIAPLPRTSITIAPSERYDVVIDFSRYKVGTRVTMHNTLADGSAGRVMQFHVVRKESDDSAIPDHLSDIEPLDPGKAAAHRTFKFDHDGDVWTINGQRFSYHTVLARPKLNDIEVWTFDAGGADHPIHVHLDHFQVLGEKQLHAAEHPQWKDTVSLERGQRTNVVIRFAGYRGRYLFHCHNLEHEDMAMMANYIIE